MLAWTLYFIHGRIQLGTPSYRTFILGCRLDTYLIFFLLRLFPSSSSFLLSSCRSALFWHLPDIAIIGCWKFTVPTIDTDYKYSWWSSALPFQLAPRKKISTVLNAVHEIEVNYHVSILISSKWLFSTKLNIGTFDVSNLLWLQRFVQRWQFCEEQVILPLFSTRRKKERQVSNNYSNLVHHIID